LIRTISRMAAVAAILVGITAVVATSPPAAIPGGVLDPRFPGADVYLTAPERAKPPAGRACEAAERYVDLVNAGRFGDVAGLFAEDALLLDPMRHTYRGSEQIHSFYEGRIGAMRPEVVPVAYVGDDRDCMVELAAKSDVGGERRFALVSVDHFTLEASGKVSRMIAFARPPPTP
jgi:hypothetical protein